MTREYSATLQGIFHQLSGVNSMVEQVMMVVSYLVQYRMEMILKNFAHRQQSIN